MVTKEDVRRVAVLAKLAVAEEDLERLTADMTEIIAFADTVGAAVEADGAPFEGIHGLQNAFREDVVVPSFPQEEILRGVDGGENGFFPVKKRQ